MAASQGIVERAMAVQGRLRPVARFGALYTIAMSCVLVWRGTWVGWDCVYEHFHNSHLTITVRDTKEEEEEDTVVAYAANTPVMATSSSFLEHSPAHTAIKSTDPGHLTSSGLTSHVFAIVALMSCGVFASVLAPPAAVSVIKDLAIQASKRPSGTTTSYFKKRPEIQNRAFEFVPHLAQHLKTSTSSTSINRGMATSARGFKSATTLATRR